MNGPKMFQGTRTVYWVCDKNDCLKENYRIILTGHTVYNDRCDGCYSNIHEPILINVIEDNKNGGPKTSH